MKTYVIIGGDAAGMSAAMQIRRKEPDAKIFAFEKGDTFSYAQCGLPYYIEGVVPSADKLVARTAEQFREKHNIEALPRHEVVEIKPDEKKVRVKNLLQDELSEYDYDKLLIATGAVPIRPNWPGINLEGVFSLKTMADAEQIQDYLSRNPVKKAVIMGAGYIGLEMSEALTERGMDVTVIEKTGVVGTGLDPDMSEHAVAYVKNLVNLKLEEEVQAIQKNDNGDTPLAVKTDRDLYPADLVLVAIGVLPNSRLAADAGIKTGVKGAIQVNRRMETSLPDIYAAGDCAVQYNRIKKQDDYIPLGTHANKQGRIAGANMAGDSSEFAGVAGTSIFKVKDLHIARSGMGETEAIDAGYDVASVMIQAPDHAHYYPDPRKMHVKLLFTRDSGKIIGGQIIGYNAVDKQVDVLATALYHEMTLDEIQELDLAYAPPFATVWSPLQQAASVAKKKLK